eukprot:Rmarinus@m.28274
MQSSKGVWRRYLDGSVYLKRSAKGCDAWKMTFARSQFVSAMLSARASDECLRRKINSTLLPRETATSRISTGSFSVHSQIYAIENRCFVSGKGGLPPASPRLKPCVLVWRLPRARLRSVNENVRQEKRS